MLIPRYEVGIAVLVSSYEIQIKVSQQHAVKRATSRLSEDRKVLRNWGVACSAEATSWFPREREERSNKVAVIRYPVLVRERLRCRLPKGVSVSSAFLEGI